MERLRCLIAPSRIFMVAQWASYKKMNAASTYLRPSTTAFTFCTQGNEHIRNGDIRLVSLQERLEMSNIILESYTLRGQNQRCVCPQCGGGTIKEKSLSVFIDEKGNFALWKCFKFKCGWTGSTKTTRVPMHSSQLLDTPDPEKDASNSNCGGGAIKEKSLSVFINEKGKCFRTKCGWSGGTKRTDVPVHSSQLLDTPDPKKGASISNLSMRRNSWVLICGSEGTDTQNSEGQWTVEEKNKVPGYFSGDNNRMDTTERNLEELTTKWEKTHNTIKKILQHTQEGLKVSTDNLKALVAQLENSLLEKDIVKLDDTEEVAVHNEGTRKRTRVSLKKKAVVVPKDIENLKATVQKMTSLEEDVAVTLKDLA